MCGYGYVLYLYEDHLSEPRMIKYVAESCIEHNLGDYGVDKMK